MVSFIIGIFFLFIAWKALGLVLKVGAGCLSMVTVVAIAVAGIAFLWEAF